MTVITFTARSVTLAELFSYDNLNELLVKPHTQKGR